MAFSVFAIDRVGAFDHNDAQTTSAISVCGRVDDVERDEDARP